MLVREILEETETFPTILTDVTVREVAQLMRDQDVRAVPVVENERLIGIVTDWDIVTSVAAELDDLAERPVSAIMTSTNLITIDANASAADAAGQLRRDRVHHLPVLDGERYVGMLCLGIEWSEDEMLAPPMRPVLTARRP